MIKKILLTSAIAVSVLAPAAVMQSAYAVDVLKPTGTQGPCDNPNAASKPEICQDNITGSPNNPIAGPNGILTSVINILSLVVGIGSVIIIVIEGFRMMVASGDPGSISNARRGLIYAVVGLVVALMAQGAVALLLRKL